MQGDRTRWPFKVPSRPNHSVILFPEAADTLEGFSLLEFFCVVWMFAQSIRHECPFASAPEQGTGVGGIPGTAGGFQGKERQCHYGVMACAVPQSSCV